MHDRHRPRLLADDAVFDAVMGSCLLAFRGMTIEYFGLPKSDTYVHVTVRGAVLLGMGMALFIAHRDQDRWRRLGLGGAIVIYTLGAGTVVVWLPVDPFELPIRGYAVLWAVAIMILGTEIVELVAITRRSRRPKDSDLSTRNYTFFSC